MSLCYDTMTAEDYPTAHALWQSLSGMGLNEADESANIEAYLQRNPGQSFVCKSGREIIGTILCGNDGRRAFVYHLAVAPAFRRQGIASKLVDMALAEQRRLKIGKCALFVLKDNSEAQAFWARYGFSHVEEAATMAKKL